MSTDQQDSSPSQGNQTDGPSASPPPPDAPPEPGERPEWGGRQHIDRNFDPNADIADPAAE